MSEFIDEDVKDLAVLAAEGENLACRFYANMYPEPEEVVIVNVTEIGEMGAYVTLLEYDNIEGMVLLSELTRRRIKSMNKLIRVNRTEVVMVLRVDKEKGYIDLSKRRVDPEDVIKCEDRYNKAKAVHSVLRHVATANNKSLEYMYTIIGWPLYKKFGHAYDAFKIALNDVSEMPIDIFEGIDNVPEEYKAQVLSYVRRRLAPQPIKIRADVEVTCFTYEGIDAIKECLLEGERVGSLPNTIIDEATGAESQGAKHQVNIKLVAAPIYVITCMTLEKESGIEALTRSIKAATSVIVKFGGTLEVKMAPKAVTLKEESELQAMLDRIAAEQEEIDGDEPEEE